MNVSLVKYDAACRALEEAKNVDEVKEIRNKAEAMRAYAKQAKNRQLELDAAEIRIRAERRLGEMIIIQKETVGLNPGMAGGAKRTASGTFSEPLDTRPTLAEAGIDKKLSARAQKFARMPEEKFEEDLSKWKDKLVGESKAHVSFNAGDNEWYTPKHLIESARVVMGSIDLDPASTETANKVVKASIFYTIEQNGLKQPWRGNIWLNPPYAQPEIQRFSETLVLKVQRKEIIQATVLVNNATETSWFQMLAKDATAICFLKGRVKFWAPDKISAPLQGQAIIYYGPNGERFCDEFAPKGFTAWIAKS